MNTNGLARHYGSLTPEERLPLVLAATWRGDGPERARLLASAPRVAYQTGNPFALRPYQNEAADVFHAGGTEKGGSGVIVLPCGAGKTVVGIAALHRLQTQCLILTTNTIAVRQWRTELLDKTTLGDDQVGEYTGDSK